MIWIYIIATFGLLPSAGVVTSSREPPARAAPKVSTLYVKPAGAGECTSWADACELQSALGRAVTGDKIWVAAGAYKPTGGTDRTVSFHLVAGVAVYGGFPGDGDPGFADRNWETCVTVLSGDIDGNDLTGPHGVITDTANITAINSYHVVTSSGLTDTAVLDGFTISGGHASGRDLHGHGGGMYNDNSSPTLTNLTFSGNRAHYDVGDGQLSQQQPGPGQWHSQQRLGRR